MKNYFRFFSNCLKTLVDRPMRVGILVAMILLFGSPAQSAEVTLELSPKAGQGQLGHKIYYGTSNMNYTYCIDLANSTSCVISGLEEGYTYYFAATAYDPSGYESDFSNEVSKHISAGNLFGGDSSVKEELIIDTDSKSFSASSNDWAHSSYIPGAYDTHYRFATPGDGDKWAKWKFSLSTSGESEVFARWTEASNRSAEAPYVIINNGVEVSIVEADQTINGGQFVSLGTYWLEAGVVEVVLKDVASGFVIADAVKILTQ